MSSFSAQDIKIIVDSVPQGRSGTFVPGQTIRGKVLYNPKSQVDIDNIIIIFKGICFTQIVERSGNNTHRYPEKIVLFRFQQNLFRGPHTLPPSQNEWPFQFVLPNRVTYNRSSTSNDGQYQVGEQPLPSSFVLVPESGGSGSRSLVASITYKLKVKVNPDRMLHSTENHVQIPVWRSSPVPLPRPRSLDGPCTGDCQFKSRGLRPTQHTFSEKMKHILSNDPSLKTPSINVRTSVKMPRSAGISQYLPIEISCKQWRTSENVPVDPVLTLSHVDISLKSYCMVRAFGTISDHTKNAKMRIFDHRIPGKNIRMPLDGTFVEFTEPLRLMDMKKNLHDLVPTFKTFTINMSYKLTVEVCIRHADTRHAFNLESKYPFQILEEDPPSVNETSISQLPSQLEDSHLGPPPVFEDAASSSYAPPAFEGSAAPPSYNSGDVWQTDSKSRIF